MNAPPSEPWNGEYEKVFYFVHLPSGEIVKCWPNAGHMVAVDGSGRQWSKQDRIFASVAPGYEDKYQQDRARTLSSSILATAETSYWHAIHGTENKRRKKLRSQKKR